MITGIVGLGGVGKTSLMVYLLKEAVVNERRKSLRDCIQAIEAFNAKRKTPLTLPDRAPFYTNFDVTIPIGYKKYYSPYFLNPYYFGLPNLDKEVQAVMPHGKLFFSETDNIYDSREKSLPAAVSGIYNKQRHFNLNIYIEVHRGMNTDTLIRGNVHRYIEIMKQEHEKDRLGQIIKTTWYCREFEGEKAYLAYVESKGKLENYTTTTYTNFGNIFKYYNSQGCREEFLPAEGGNFSLLEQPGKVNVKTLPPEIAKFYNLSEPKNWREK